MVVSSWFCLRTSKTLSLGRFDAPHLYMHFPVHLTCFWPKIPKFICIIISRCQDSSYLSILVLFTGVSGIWSQTDAIRSFMRQVGSWSVFQRLARPPLRLARRLQHVQPSIRRWRPLEASKPPKNQLTATRSDTTATRSRLGRQPI